MKIGFTGTQEGMTGAQSRKLAEGLEIVQLATNANQFHHGDCIGADCEAHGIALALDYAIVIHPPIKSSKRAFCKTYSEMREADEYLVRNRHIVDECDALVACPKGPEELRSGTWSTVRYARKNSKRTIIIMPDGTIEGE